MQRTRKQNALEREKMISKLTSIDDRAKHLREDRNDYVESRKFMVQKLKKDLEKMKAGLMDITEIERKYAFLHNDKEFQLMMVEIKREIHPGSLSSPEQSLLAKKKKGKLGRMQDGVKSSMSLKPEAKAADANKSATGGDTAKSREPKAGDDKPADSKAEDGRHPDAIRPDTKREEITEAERSRVKKQAIAELQQRQVADSDQNKEVLDVLTEEQKRERDRTKELAGVSDPVARERLELKYDTERAKVKQKMKNMVKRHAEEISKLENAV